MDQYYYWYQLFAATATTCPAAKTPIIDRQPTHVWTHFPSSTHLRSFTTLYPVATQEFPPPPPPPISRANTPTLPGSNMVTPPRHVPGTSPHHPRPFPSRNRPFLKPGSRQMTIGTPTNPEGRSSTGAFNPRRGAATVNLQDYLHSKYSPDARVLQHLRLHRTVFVQRQVHQFGSYTVDCRIRILDSLDTAHSRTAHRPKQAWVGRLARVAADDPMRRWHHPLFFKIEGSGCHSRSTTPYSRQHSSIQNYGCHNLHATTDGRHSLRHRSSSR